MKEIPVDKNFIAYCGLYCGACRKFLKGKCKGCRENTKATWCKIRKCCIENKLRSCADCRLFDTVADCKKFNNLISKLFSVIFGSNRVKGIELIKRMGYDNYASYMATKRIMSIKK